MKKKISLMTMLVVIGGMNLYAQVLQNTSWAVYDTTNALDGIYHFGVDTISYSTDNVTYDNLATYQESGNNISIVDLDSFPCHITDTGKYTFAIQHDTLLFHLIIDSCIGRRITVSSFHWISRPVGIQDVHVFSMIRTYPNPAKDVLNIESNHNSLNSKYIIYDEYGRQLITGQLTGEITSVNINQLTKGLYFLQIGEEGRQTYKIIKK